MLLDKAPRRAGERTGEVLICYDSTNGKSLTNAVQWLEDFRKHSSEGVPVVLVACKLDLLQEGASSPSGQGAKQQEF